MQKLLADTAPQLIAGKPVDNRAAWSTVLDASSAPSRFGQLTVVPSLIRVYIAALDGTPRVERDLGQLARVLVVAFFS